MSRALRRRGAVSVATATLTAVITASSAIAADAPTRLYGSTRIETAVEISKANFAPDGPFSVYVASAANYPDALAAGALAADNGAPLLLVPADGVLPPVVADEIRWLKPVSLYLFGGEAAVSGALESQLKDLVANEYRWDGDNRYETAAKASAFIGGTGKTVYLASGTTFADALAGALSPGGSAAA